MSSLYFLSVFLVVLTYLPFSEQIANFSFNIRKKGKFCLNEYYPDQTLLTLMIFADKPESLNVIVRDPEYKKVAEKKNINSFKDSFTTFYGGHYEFCMLNTLKEDIKVDFEARSGIAAKDYSQVPTIKDLQPIEQDLAKLEDYSKEIYHLIMYADSHEKTYGDLQNGILMGISWVSVIVIIVMLAVGGVEAFVGRKIVMTRKYR